MKPAELLFDLPPVLKLDGSIHRFPEGIKTDKYTHTLHRFPGKFVPQVASELIDIVVNNTKKSALPILDPFCGCGTTNVEAAIKGVASIGTDFDPLAAFISKLKTTVLSNDEISELKKFWSTPFPQKLSTYWTPPVNNLTHWFSRECIIELAYLKDCCNKLSTENLRSFSLGVFSAIIRRVSNADDQTQKTYVSGTLKKSPPLPRELFPVFMNKAILGIASYSRNCYSEPLIYKDDARQLDVVNKIRGVVTSPPYLDSIDYIYNQMLEYFWLFEELGLSSPLEISKLRKQPMGFVRRNIDEEINKIHIYSPRGAKIVRKYALNVSNTSKKEADHIASFFMDFLKHLIEVKQKIVQDGVYSIVIGESTIRGYTIPTPEILKILFKDLEFEYIGGCGYEIRRHYMKFPRHENSGKIKVDYVLCFRC